jgi:hypothetical protein
VERFLARADRAALAGLLAAVSARLLDPPERTSAAPARDRWISAAEARQIAGLSERFIYDRAHELPFVRRAGRRVLVSEAGLRRWLDERTA